MGGRTLARCRERGCPVRFAAGPDRWCVWHEAERLNVHGPDPAAVGLLGAPGGVVGRAQAVMGGRSKAEAAQQDAAVSRAPNGDTPERQRP
jgi:hypothetical protein